MPIRKIILASWQALALTWALSLLLALGFCTHFLLKNGIDYDQAHLYPVTQVDDSRSAAQKNLAPFGERVTVVTSDAFLYIARDDIGKFDLIFLDGPKAQYINYLPFLKELLNEGGVLVADNVYFHGLVRQAGEVKHKLRTIVVNLRKFIDAICLDEDLESEILDIGDGLSVSRKRGGHGQA